MKDLIIYRPKTLIDGERIGLTGKYVAIPDKRYKGHGIRVIYKNKEQIIPSWDKALTYRVFEDKFGSGSYKLGYFKVDFE